MMNPEIDQHSKNKSVEQALRESELKWRQLAETAPDIIISIGPDGKILFINRVISTLTKNEVIGKDATSFVPPDHAATLKKALEKVFKEGVATEYEILGRTKDNGPIWYHSRIAPVIIDGQVVSATLVSRDITERKKMENELREARDSLEKKVLERTAEIQKTLSLLEASLESTADGVMVMDLNRRVVQCNKTFLEMWPEGMANPYEYSDGYRALKIASELMLNPDEVIQRTEAIYNNPAQKSADLLKLKDGRIIERVSNPQILNGKIIGRVWNYRDITLQLRAEAERDRLLEHEHQERIEAEKSVQARDDFLAMASHELRTPLTPLKMYLDWFKREARKIQPDLLPKAENLLKALDYTDREINRLIQLTDDLLDVTRISAGRLILNREPMNLVELVSQVRKEKFDELTKKQCSLIVKKDGPVNGVWDYNRIEQVFSCLLSNAMKYGSGKPIEVTVDTDKEKAVLKVTDQGPGISMKDREKIFQRFERAASIKNYDGLGLGLYISKEIVDAHGGTISVESEIGKGSTFTVSLPL